MNIAGSGESILGRILFAIENAEPKWQLLLGAGDFITGKFITDVGIEV